MEHTVKTSQSGKKFDKAEDVEDLVKQIHDNENHLETIQLEGNSYGIEPLKEIGCALQSCHNLKHLLLNDMFISRLKNEIPEALRFLLGGVQSSRAHISTLNLNDNAIGPVTMPDLLPFLKSEQCSSLKYLYLNNCGLGIKGGTMLASVLSDMENLTELVIGRNRLEIDGIMEISLALSKLNKLERLEMPQNGTKDKAIISLCEALKQNSNLKILNLNDNVLTNTVNELASTLKALEQLETLNLGDCLLKTTGVIRILSALNDLYINKQHSSIKEIILSGNEIGKDAKDIIITTLETILDTRPNHLPKLKVDLSCNNFGEELSDELKKHFGRKIDLIIEDDQGSENEADGQDDEYTNDDSRDLNQSTKSDQSFTIDPSDDLYENPEQLQEFIESRYEDLNSLCRRFFHVATKGFDRKENSLNEQASIEIECLIKVGKKRFLKNNTDFKLLNNLLVTCGLMKSEDKNLSPRRDSDLSGPILALAKVFKEFNHDLNQKRCLKDLLKQKVEEERYKNIQHHILSLLYKF